MKKTIAVLLGAIALGVLGFGALLLYSIADEYGLGVELAPIVVIVLVMSGLFALAARWLYASGSNRPVGVRVDDEDPRHAV